MDKSKPEGKPLEAKRQYHSREFKIEAVRRLEEGKVLGVKRSIIYRWKKELATVRQKTKFRNMSWVKE
ncbi:hypothetical protein ACM1PE_30375 [Achromobacter sp. PD1]|uniref:hypothetical protein n=1 Tax=Achromobacter sp. PD1 TaxID=3399125 RepID=UPI003AF662FC